MNIKELLLNGKGFLALLNEFAIDVNDIKIQDESMIWNAQNLAHQEIVKETICIEGKNANGIFNLFGVIHCNLLNKLAVFEMHGYEQVSLRTN